jgi:hypothetical protein
MFEPWGWVMRRSSADPGWRLLALLALLAGGGAPRCAAADDPSCTLADTTAAPSTCLTCHPFTSCHPYDVDYARLASGSRGSLREAEEAVRRGLFLPGGRMTCHTCHDAGSWWGQRIVIPPGSTVSARVVPKDPSTYDPSSPRIPQTTVEQARATLPRDTALSPKPLCLACHARD